MSDKYLSIITNFGCHYTCPYCIVKNNNMDIPKTTIEGLKCLKKEIVSNNCNIVSISGGGDPLFQYEKHTDYYNTLFNILEEMKIPLELHTSYTDSSFPYERCVRVVYHLNMNNKNLVKTLTRHGNEIIRVVFVVTDEMTEKDIINIVEMVKENKSITELSFRQMVRKNYEISYNLYDFLQKGHQKDWYYITQCDYNTYYAENKISNKFESFRKEIG